MNSGPKKNQSRCKKIYKVQKKEKQRFPKERYNDPSCYIRGDGSCFNYLCFRYVY